MEERWGGQEFLGSKCKVLIYTRLAEDGNWSQFLGEAFVQCGDIPLMMAGSKIQPEKVKVETREGFLSKLIIFTLKRESDSCLIVLYVLYLCQCLIRSHARKYLQINVETKFLSL